MARDKYAQWMGMNPATQSAIDTATRARTILPTNPLEGLVMLIHAIELFCGAPAAVAENWVSAVLSSIDAAVFVQDPEHVASYELKAVGAPAAGFTIFPIMGRGNLINYDKPFIYPLQHMYLGCYSSITGVVNNAQCRILYTLVKVTTEELLQAIAAWQG